MQIKHKEVRAYISELFFYYRFIVLVVMLWASGSSVESVITLLK